MCGFIQAPKTAELAPKQFTLTPQYKVSNHGQAHVDALKALLKEPSQNKATNDSFVKNSDLEAKLTQLQIIQQG